jgi:hypothetical protein
MFDILINLACILGGVGGLFFIVFLLGKILMQGKKARQLSMLPCGFEFHSGGRIDGITLTYPLIKLRIEDAAIFIQYMGVDLVLEYKNIVKVEIKNEWTSRGIKLNHFINNYPHEIVIFTPYWHLLQEFIEKKQHGS